MMRILVATNKTNGSAPGDYDFCVEGELVYMQDPCGADRIDPDGGGCGCGRGFAGTNSHRATTTAQVVDSQLSSAQVREALRSSLEAGGWIAPDLVPPDEAEAAVEELMDDMVRVARHFPVGSVVRRRLSQFYVL
ncbi:MAG TPA: hypothetical protein VFK34_09665 [Marmoricola sp.]|jgi:hypothetical protein|nr:hypothetical protein [Marmoricola sp.]